MSATSKTVPKKVTKIIRKDGITYRPAGGIPQTEPISEPIISKTPASPAKSFKPFAASSQGKKKTLGKVIKRADGSKIVVVDGKIVKTMKANTEDSPALLKSEEDLKISSQSKSTYDEALSPLTDISADELPSDMPDDKAAQINDEPERLSDQNASSSVFSIKRTILINQRGSPAPLLENPRSFDDGRSSSSSKHFATKKGDVDGRASRPSHPSRRTTHLKRPHDETRSRQSSHKSRDRVDANKYKDAKEAVPQPSKRAHKPRWTRSERRERRERSERTRSPHRSRSPRDSRGSGKYRPQKRPKGRSRSISPKVGSFDKRSPKAPVIEAEVPQDAHSGLTSLLDLDATNCSKENILNMIQKQAEQMLQAQHTGPIDEEKKVKLREAMESILQKRGLIAGSNRKTRKDSMIRSASSESSDGRDSPEILKKLHEKYNTTAEAANDGGKAVEDPLDMEAISPCIDNISNASNDQVVSDVSHSDMEMSDDEQKNDNEDGKTPAYRKKPDTSEDLTRESSSQLIQIKLGKDEDEEAFQALAARVDDLKSSADVQDLIQAIESRIKSYLSENMDPSNLEKKIKRYQKLVAKVVIEAESIKDKEEDDKVTYHRHQRSKSKEIKSSKPEVNSAPVATISYPMQPPEQRQPWLHQNPAPRQNFDQRNPHTPLMHDVQEHVSEPSEYEKIHAQYVSERVGYHVCLLCMIETTVPSHFQKHLNGKKHRDAVLAKIKKLNSADEPNVKKFKKHDLVIKCQLCDVICHGQKKYNEHANHRSHHALVQAYVKIGRVVPEPEILHDHENQIREQLESIQESDTPAVGREYMSVKTVKDCDDNIKDVYHCSLCKINCNSEIQVEKHVRSKKHYLIYVKVTQPEVNIQVNAAEHKKRRETTNKIVNAMKTIKQMEQMIERNRDRRDNEASTLVNKDQQSNEIPPNRLNSSAPAGLQMGHSSNIPFSAGTGPAAFRYQNHQSSPNKVDPQNAPYYRDPTSRLASSQPSSPFGSNRPSPSRALGSSQNNFIDNRPSASNSHEGIPMSNPAPTMNFNTASQEQFNRQSPGGRRSDTYSHGMFNTQDHPTPDFASSSNFSNSMSRPAGYSNAYDSSASDPQQPSNPYSSTYDSSTNRPGSIGSDAYRADKSKQSSRFPPFNQPNQFNEHQAYVSSTYKNHGPSNSFTNREQPMGLNYNNSSSSSYSLQPEQNFQSKQPWMGSGKNPSEQNFQSQQPWMGSGKNPSEQNFQSKQPWMGSGKTPSNKDLGYQSHQSYYDQKNSNNPSQSDHGNYFEQPSGGASWPNKEWNTGMNPSYNNASASFSDYQDGGTGTFNSAAPSYQPNADQSRNTYSSAYNRLKQGDTQQNSSGSYSYGPTYSHKPTYNGVYTNVRR